MKKIVKTSVRNDAELIIFILFEGILGFYIFAKKNKTDDDDDKLVLKRQKM